MTFASISTQPRHIARSMCLLAALSSVAALAQDIPEGSSARQIGSDNVANTAGPSIVNFNGTNEILYTNHSNDTLYADPGLTGNPTNTGIAVGGLFQVKATVLNNTLYVSYISSAGVPSLASSTNGVTVFV